MSRHRTQEIMNMCDIMKQISKQERIYFLPPSVSMKILKQAKLSVANSSGQQTPQPPAVNNLAIQN